MANSPSATSIDLTWTQEVGELVTSYEVTFSYQGPCAFTDSGNITLGSNSRSRTLTGLQEFSSYTVSVTTVNDGGRSTPQTRTVTTMSAGKSITGKGWIEVKWAENLESKRVYFLIVQKHIQCCMIADHCQCGHTFHQHLCYILMLFKIPEYLH